MASVESKKQANPDIQVQTGSSLFEVQVKVNKIDLISALRSRIKLEKKI
jgi:hypothetical protein